MWLVIKTGLNLVWSTPIIFRFQNSRSIFYSINSYWLIMTPCPKFFLKRIEVIKGRYRKSATEYPYRCIGDPVKKRADVNIVDGKEIGRRRYLTLMRGQDRFLAEMATNAGCIS